MFCGFTANSKSWFDVIMERCTVSSCYCYSMLMYIRFSIWGITLIIQFSPIYDIWLRGIKECNYMSKYSEYFNKHSSFQGCTSECCSTQYIHLFYTCSEIWVWAPSTCTYYLCHNQALVLWEKTLLSRARTRKSANIHNYLAHLAVDNWTSLIKHSRLRLCSSATTSWSDAEVSPLDTLYPSYCVCTIQWWSVAVFDLLSLPKVVVVSVSKIAHMD